MTATISETAVTYPPTQLTANYAKFLAANPGFAATRLLDELRRTEFKRLDDQNQVYLDYTGGGMYGRSQLDKHFAMLQTQVLGNPHSANPTSLAMTEMVESARQYVLDYFNASENYIAVFTPNASGALKHVGESYPFEPGGKYALAFDNHNSVNGIREYVRGKGAAFKYVPLTVPDLRMDEDKLAAVLDDIDPDHPHLFAFPAQSNFSGVKHPLSYVELAHSKGWDVLLDVAAFVPTNKLDLSSIQPDFVCMSFYKMFGYPTGLGCLLIHKRVYGKLKRPWFAGGTVNFASVQGEGHYLAPNEAAFEDGTIDYLSIPAIKIGLQQIESIGIDTIGRRVEYLTGWLLENLYQLQHSNGRPLARIYGPTTTEMRGGTVTFNPYGPDGVLLDYRRVEELANQVNISLRTGCFCNPGAGEIAEGLTAEDMLIGLQEAEDIDLPRFVQLIQHRGNKSAGAIRISVGLASNFADVYRFMNFAAGFRDQTNLQMGKVSYDILGCRQIRDGT